MTTRKTIALTRQTSVGKVMFLAFNMLFRYKKIFRARLQHYINRELPDVQTGFRKARGTRDQIVNIHWIIEKARVPENHLLLLY